MITKKLKDMEVQDMLEFEPGDYHAVRKAIQRIPEKVFTSRVIKSPDSNGGQALVDKLVVVRIR